MCKAWEDMRAEATENGEKVGKEIGEKIGKEIGEKIGKEIGKEEKAREIAKKLLENGSFSAIQIAELTGLPVDVVEKMG